VGLNRNEQNLAALLDREGIRYEAQGLVAGHRIDFVVRGRFVVAVDANGEWWHSKPKIVACDVVKLARVSREAVVLGVWDWRIVQEPEEVVHAIVMAREWGEPPPWWDWKAPKPA
jgi:hypothetical protein